METTILIEFLGGSVASGLTWDLIKSAGKGLFDSFKKIFVNKKDFSNNSDAEEFLQYISENKVANRDEAEKNAKSWYEKRTGQQDSQEFIKELVEWIKDNQKQFTHLLKQNDSINISDINPSGKSTSVIQVTKDNTINGSIIGIQNNK